MDKQIAFFTSEVKENDRGEYTGIAGSPVYEPKGRKPHVRLLCNLGKQSALIRRIEASRVAEEEKEFLRLAASRHVVFNYEDIAEYYAHAGPEMQRLMEESALVIPDVESAIENGYVQLTEVVRRLYAEAEAEASREE